MSPALVDWLRRGAAIEARKRTQAEIRCKAFNLRGALIVVTPNRILPICPGLQS
jgi:hypothetical protein